MLVSLAPQVIQLRVYVDSFLKAFRPAVEAGAVASQASDAPERYAAWVSRIQDLRLRMPSYIAERCHLIGDPLASRIVRATEWSMQMALVLNANRQAGVEFVQADAEAVLKGMQNYQTELDEIARHCLDAMREAGLKIPGAVGDPAPPIVLGGE